MVPTSIHPPSVESRKSAESAVQKPKRRECNKNMQNEIISTLMSHYRKLKSSSFHAHFVLGKTVEICPVVSYKKAV